MQDVEYVFTTLLALWFWWYPVGVWALPFDRCCVFWSGLFFVCLSWIEVHCSGKVENGSEFLLSRKVCSVMEWAILLLFVSLVPWTCWHRWDTSGCPWLHHLAYVMVDIVIERKVFPNEEKLFYSNREVYHGKGDEEKLWFTWVCKLYFMR